MELETVVESPRGRQLSVEIVLPAYNEMGSLPSLINSIFEEFDGAIGTPVDLTSIVIVNDGSDDGLRTYQPSDSRVKIVHLSRNFGKESAILAGLDNSSADYVIIMDADGQHRPCDALRLVTTAVQHSVEQVVGLRDRSIDPRMRVFLSRGYYWLAGKVLGVKVMDGAGDFRAMSRKVVDAVCLMRENDRFSKGLYEWVGFSALELEIRTAPRISGESKFSFRSLLRLASSSLFGFNDGLLRRLMWLGLLSVTISAGLLIPVFWSLISGAGAPDGFLTLAGLQFLLAGTQVLLLSLVGEYIARTHRQGRQRPVYLIDEVSCGEAMSDQDGEA